MPLNIGRSSAVGATDLSPAFQGWEPSRSRSSAVGTTESEQFQSRQSSLQDSNPLPLKTQRSNAGLRSVAATRLETQYQVTLGVTPARLWDRRSRRPRRGMEDARLAGEPRGGAEIHLRRAQRPGARQRSAAGSARRFGVQAAGLGQHVGADPEPLGVRRHLDRARRVFFHRRGCALDRFAQEAAGELALHHARRHPFDSLGRVLGDRHGDALDAGEALVHALDLRVRLVGLDLDHQFECVIAGHSGIARRIQGESTFFGFEVSKVLKSL